MNIHVNRCCVALCALAATASAVPASARSPYFSHRFVVGERFSDLFSVTYSVKGDGIPETATHYAGSATYVVTAVRGGIVTMRLTYRYDGIEAGHPTVRVDADSFEAISKTGVRRPSLDGSGLFFNPNVWGTIPGDLRPGARWSVRLSQPWELGPAGRQDERVVSLVAATGTIALERSGNAPGPIRSDASNPTFLLGGHMKVRVVHPGPMRWHGSTTFERGIVISDDLLAERDVDLVTPGNRVYHARERMIMLLDAVPGDT